MYDPEEKEDVVLDDEDIIEVAFQRIDVYDDPAENTIIWYDTDGNQFVEVKEE